MVQDTDSGETLDQFVPVDLWNISFVAKSAAAVQAVSINSDKKELRLSIEGVGRGSSFGALSSTNFRRQYPEFGILIETVPQELELEDDTDGKFLCGLIKVRYSAAIHDIYFQSPERLDVSVLLPRETFDALYETVRSGRLGSLWIEGRPRDVLVRKDQEFWEPEEQVLYLPSNPPKPDSLLNGYWPLNQIVWREAETILIADPVEPNPVAEFANEERDDERERATEQIKNIQKQVETTLSRTSEMVRISHSVNLLGALILITLIYIAYRLS